MVRRLLLAAVLLIMVEVQRKPRHRFRQDADAGVHGGYLHGGTLVDVFADDGAAEEEAVPAAECSILGIVTGFNKAEKMPNYTSPPLKMGIRKAPTDISADALSSNSLLAKTIVATLVLVNIKTVLR